MTFASYPHKPSIHLLTPFAAILLLLLNALPALGDWPDGNHDKWVQFPDPSGFDILAAKPPAAESTLPLIIADDFECRTPGYITNIHIWASWLNENTSANPIPIPPIPITFGELSFFLSSIVFVLFFSARLSVFLSAFICVKYFSQSSADKCADFRGGITNRIIFSLERFFLSEK